MTEAANAFQYRVADNDDAGGILTVLQEAAPEIPLSLDTPELKEAIQEVIAECCASGDSWVAVDSGGSVVGVVLAKPDRLERFFKKNQAVSLRYIGVNKMNRRHGVFATLMEKLKAKGVPLTASVLDTNHSNMANRLLKVGFTKTESDAKEARFRWAPLAQQTSGPSHTA